MEQYIEFATNHWELVLAFVVTLLMLIISEMRKGGKTVSTFIATQMINKDGAAILDIRQKKEFQTGHILSSINIPLAEIDKRMNELEKYREKPIIVVCNLGQTSSGASKKLLDAKFANVVRLQGGITEWKAQNLPVVKK